MQDDTVVSDRTRWLERVNERRLEGWRMKTLTAKRDELMEAAFDALDGPSSGWSLSSGGDPNGRPQSDNRRSIRCYRTRTVLTE